MQKMLFIYNPRAGTGQIRASLSYILEEFAQHDMQITVHPTLGAGDAVKTVRKTGKKYDLIVCSGGDGTLDEVVTGMLDGGFRKPVGYIPGGSTNDFASSLGIPKQMRKAAASIARGNVYSCDLGKLNDGYFVYVGAFGAFTEVSYKTSQDAKNMLGHLAYVLEGMKSLSALKSWEMTFHSEEKQGHGMFLYGMITNSDSVGGFKGITGQNVDMNDGVFEVTLIRMPENIIEYPEIVNSILTGEPSELVITFKTARVEFFSQEEVPWTRDGEFGGNHTHVVIENLHGALPILLGEDVDILSMDDAEEKERELLSDETEADDRK
jgi:YegS/Rv2252/BmrU family lipid kinase